MSDLWKDLLTCLDVEAVSGSGPDRVYEGRNLNLTYHRIFGGQLLAQFLRVAELTCPEKSVKSLHALFPREGRADEPVRYEVRRQHEGGTYATVSVVAQQSKGVVATASISMHIAEEGPEQQSTEPVPVVPGAEHRTDLHLVPWETRSVTDLDSPKPEPADYELWMRTPDVDPALAPALTAYATDLTLIGTALLPVDGVSQRDAQTAFTSAVTSHTVWFHRPFRTDGWLLLRQHSPILARGRSFGRGDILTEDGSLVASFAQEALLRFKQS